MRTLTKGSALLLSLLPGITWPLGLGDIEVDTVLNQPLRAEIRLLSIAPEEVEDVRVKLAPQAAFDRVGIVRPYVLNQLQFTPTVQGGVPSITVSTKKPVREPFLNFLIEVVWPKGRLLREYTVLLDPPVFHERQASVATQAPAVAQRPRQAAAPTRPARPAAVTPARAARAATTAGESFPRMAADQAAAQELESLGQGVPATRYEVKRGDTLMEIARENTADIDLGVEQFMIAVLRANPEAFADENINNLKSGYILRLPNADTVRAVGQEEALAEVKHHYALWREYRAQLAGVAVQSQGAALAEAEVAVELEAEVAVEQEAEAGSAEKLEILAADESGEGLQETAVGGGERVGELQRQAALAQELAQSRQQENEELQGRIRELEDMIAQQERIIALQSEELAELQQRLEEPEATVPAIIEETGEIAEEGVEEAEVFEAEPFEPEPLEPEEGVEAAEVEAIADSEVATEVTELEVGEEQAGGEAEPTAEVSEPIVETDVALGEVMPAEEAEPVATEASEAAQAPTAGESASASGWSDLLANPMWLLALAGAGLLVLALLLRLMTRGRREEAAELELDELSAQELAEQREEQPVTLTAVDDEPVQEPAAAVAQRAEPPADELRQAADSAQAEPVAEAAAEEAAGGGSGDEVLAEADVYIAYGLHQQAEELLRDALAHDPQRNDYGLKLLEAHYGANNKDAFDELAQELHARGTVSDELWSRAVAMGKDLSPENPLFQDAAASGVSVEDFAAKKPEMTDIDLGGDALDDSQPVGEAALGAEAVEVSAFAGEDESAADDVDATTIVTMPEMIIPQAADESMQPSPFEEQSSAGGLMSETGGEGPKTEEIDASGPLAEMAQEAAGAEIDDNLLEFNVEDLDLSKDLEDAATEAVDADEDELLDFDLADLDMEADTPSVEMQDLKADSGEIDTQIEDTEVSFDLTADQGSDESGTAELTATVADNAPTEPLPEEYAEAEGMDSTEQIELSEQDAAMLDELLGDEGEMADLGDLEIGDEINTKLDLAKAYIDMGDADGARSTLEEVLQEGNSDQRKEAEDLIRQIA